MFELYVLNRQIIRQEEPFDDGILQRKRNYPRNPFVGGSELHMRGNVEEL
jgi:hypothetical protein